MKLTIQDKSLFRNILLAKECNIMLKNTIAYNQIKFIKLKVNKLWKTIQIN